MKKYWFTSDNHFSHRNIIKYCNRPFTDSDEMNNTMIANWNAVVSPDDIVYHLGDFAFEKDRPTLENLMSQLNGEKHIIWGHNSIPVSYHCVIHFVTVSKRTIAVFDNISMRKMII